VTFSDDVKHAFRQLRKSGAFTLSAIAVLAVGIGANSAVFSVVNAMLLKTLTVPEHERVVQLMRRNQRFNLYCVGASDLKAWGQQTQILEDVTGYSYVPDQINLTEGDSPEEIAAEHVSGHYFHLFGARPALGRFFTPDEDRPGAGHFVVLSHGLWQRRFGSDPEIIGKPILLGGDAYTVVGVAGGDFKGDRSAQLWLPLQADAARKDSVCSLWGAGRLKRGVTLEQAKAVLKIAAEEYKRAFPAKIDDIGLAALPAKLTYTAEPMETIVTGDVRPALLVLLAAVGCVLLIGCANIANLLLVRGAGRGREIAIRRALGAGPSRIMRQLLTESVLLSLMGGASGLVLAAIVVRALPPLEPMNIARIGPSPREINLDGPVLAVTAALSVVTGILFGLMPAWQVSRTDLNHMLKQGGAASGGSSHRLRGVLVTGEVALSVMLLAAAGLMVRSFLAVQSGTTGFDSHNVLVLETAITGSRFDHMTDISTMVRKTMGRLVALPGVEAVSAEDSVPLLPNIGRAFMIDDQLGGSRWRSVTPGYFGVFRIPIIEGRGLRESDDSHAPPVVLVNQAMAQRYWRGQDPVGKRLSFLGASGSRGPSAEVVGVVANAREVDRKGPIDPVVYVPLDQVDAPFFASMRVWLQSLSWTIRTRDAPGAVLAGVQREFRSAAGLPVGNIRPMEQVVAASTAHDAWQTVLLGIFALVAVLLASIGLQGVLAYSAQQRTREFGIRLALGASGSQLRALIVREGMGYTATGIFVGLGGAFGLTRLMSALLFGVRAADPLVFTIAAAVLALVALVASYVPARRASSVDPAIALRYE
jgi:putative ABC transport system permease protein